MWEVPDHVWGGVSGSPPHSEDEPWLVAAMASVLLSKQGCHQLRWAMTGLW